MMDFFLGSLYTIIILGLGFLIGFKLRWEKKTDIEKPIQKSLLPPIGSGTVKMLTPEERLNQKDAERKKVREMVGEK